MPIENYTKYIPISLEDLQQSLRLSPLYLLYKIIREKVAEMIVWITSKCLNPFRAPEEIYCIRSQEIKRTAIKTKDSLKDKESHSLLLVSNSDESKFLYPDTSVAFSFSVELARAYNGEIVEFEPEHIYKPGFRDFALQMAANVMQRIREIPITDKKKIIFIREFDRILSKEVEKKDEFEILPENPSEDIDRDVGLLEASDTSDNITSTMLSAIRSTFKRGISDAMNREDIIIVLGVSDTTLPPIAYSPYFTKISFI